MGVVTRLTRRRRQLVEEKARVLNRMQCDLQAVCPGLLAITGEADNLWFLNLLACRDDIRKLAGLRLRSLLGIAAIGRKYAALIQAWQACALFSDEAQWAGPMIVADARRILALKREIDALETAMTEIACDCELARRIDTVPGFGAVCSAELAGEIGTLDRFSTEASLALYLGMASLAHSTGLHPGSRRPRQVNTRARSAMMTGVARPIGQVPRSRAYYDKKRAQGKTHNQAVRALGRHLVRVLWSMLKHGHNYEMR